MKYEIDFIGIDKEGKDSDAICLRYFDEADNRFHIGIYDGGTKDYGIEMKEHIGKYYKQGNEEIVIDFVVCSHPHIDHAPGLLEILKEYKVRKVYMNRPWQYIDDLVGLVKDGRITENSLEDRLRDKYKYIDEIEKICEEKNIEIKEAFQGTIIDNRFRILSPTRSFYIELLIESNKTPEMDQKYECLIETEDFKRNNTSKLIDETWYMDSLREEVETDAENESSVIIYGDLDNERLLFVADAGIRAITKAMDYMDKLGINYKNIDIYQIPHHGGRHNVSPSLLNRLLGAIVGKDKEDGRKAFALVSKNSDQPKKMVTNAYKRRGIKVFETKGISIRHNNNMPKREGWGTVTPVQFYDKVEDWDD